MAKQLFCFYRVNDKRLSKKEMQYMIENNIKASHLDSIYAVTDKKKLAKDFMEQRDMSQFVLVTKEDLSKEELTYFMNNHRSNVLEYFAYSKLKRDKDKDTRWDTDETAILSTFLERQTVSDKSDASLLGIPEEVKLSFPFKFTGKIHEALIALEYDNIFKIRNFFVGDGIEYYNESGDHYIGDEEWDPDYPDALIDEVEVFLYLFGNTFK